MSNVAGKSYGITVITPMSAKMSWINRWIFLAVRAFPETLAGLIGLKFIHFARWVIIPRESWPDLGQPGGDKRLTHDCMLFASNFNGTWDQYIDAFSDGIPVGLDLFWYKNFKYPGSVPITPFKDYIRANQIDTDYYYNATPGIGFRGIASALRVKRAVLALERAHAHLSPHDFALEYHRRMGEIQNDLTTHGYAPIASIDSSSADFNRQAFLSRRHGVHDTRAEMAMAQAHAETHDG